MRSSFGGFYWRGGLLAAQIAICAALLLWSAALGQSLKNLLETQSGLPISEVVSLSTNTSLALLPPQEANMRLVKAKDLLKDLPGVEGSALSSRPLLRGSGMKMTIAPVGQSVSPSDFLNVSTHSVTPDYFETLRLPFRAGRSYLPQDAMKMAGEPKPVVVNQAFVDRFFPGTDGVGRTFGYGLNTAAKPEWVIVGVVANARYRSLRESFPPTIYGLFEPGLHGEQAVLLIRSRSIGENLLAAARNRIAEQVPGLPLYEVVSLVEDRENSLALDKLMIEVVASFALLAAFVVAASFFALLAFMVAKQTKDLAVRLALGAQGRHLVWVVTGKLIAILGLGIACGQWLVFLSQPYLTGILHQTKFSEPQLQGAAMGLLLFIVLLSAAGPIFRAVRIHPAQVLREN